MLSSKRDSEPAESTPVKREDVLTVLDECGVSWFHCKTVVIAGSACGSAGPAWATHAAETRAQEQS